VCGCLRECRCRSRVSCCCRNRERSLVLLVLLTAPLSLSLSLSLCCVVVVCLLLLLLLLLTFAWLPCSPAGSAPLAGLVLLLQVVPRSPGVVLQLELPLVAALAWSTLLMSPVLRLPTHRAQAAVFVRVPQVPLPSIVSARE
jgi:hypothetical protein